MAIVRRIGVCNKPITKAKRVVRATAKRSQPVIDDIDEPDKNNELAQVEYVEELYTLYKQREGEGSFKDYMESQHDLSPNMRAGLISWLIQAHKKFELMPESLYLSISIIDRYFSVANVKETEFGLVAFAALLISSKYEEDRFQLMIHNMLDVSEHKYSRNDVVSMEKKILKSLGWYLSVPTPYVFTVRYAKASLPSDKNTEDRALYFTQMALMDYSIALNTAPSKIAASAVYAARCTLNKTPAWTQTLQYYTGYFEGHVRDLGNRLVIRHRLVTF